MLNSLWITTRWALFPIVIGMVFTTILIPNTHWDNELFHVMLESCGAFISFGLAFILMAMIQKNQLTTNYIWLIACFISMGTLDMAHSQLPPGQAFVWLHSSATFIGGLFAMLIWLPAHLSAKFFKARYLLIILCLCIGFSIVSILWVDTTLTMLDKDQQFTMTAKALNFTGGISFLIAWFYFAREYHQLHRIQSFYFSNHFCLFGLAGLVFEFSALWDGNWWFWHMLRAFAYIFLMFHFGSVYQQSLLRRIEQSGHILEQSLNEIYIFDKETLNFVDVNLCGRKNIGFSMTELRAMTPLDIMPEITASSFSRLIAPLLSATEKKILFTTMHQRKDNSYYPIEGHLQLTQEEPLLFIATILDISEQKQQKAELFELSSRLHKIASHLPGMVYQYKQRPDGSSCIPYTSETIRDIFRLSPDEVREDSSKVFEKIHPDDLDEAITSIQTSARTLQAWKHEFRVCFDDGIVHWLYGSSMPELEEDGSILWHGFITDISDKKAIELEKERLQRGLHQSQKMDALGNLTGGIAHDFNNILGIIIGNTGLAQDHFKNMHEPKLQKYLDTIQRVSERARKLVAQMMLYSRSDQGESYPMYLKPLIKDNINMLRPLLPTSIEIDLDCQKNLPRVMIEPIKFQMILMNLCLNAKDAMNSIGKLSIRLKMRQNIEEECSSCHQQLNGDWIELSVCDTGSGMDPDTLAHIFEPFYTTKEVGKGTGMGLAVVDNTVKSFNGHIIVDSEKDKGTTFRLLFQPAHSNNSSETVKNNARHITEEGKRQSILIIDDEPELAQVTSEMLEMHNYKTTAITSSSDALKLFEDNPDAFELVITDQTMPELTGFEMAAKMQQIHPQLPIILVTGYSDLIGQSEADEQGISFLKKPVRNNELLKMMAELLQKTRQ